MRTLEKIDTCPLGALVRKVETWNPQRCEPSHAFDYIDLSSIDQESKQIVSATHLQCLDAPSRARQLVQEGDVLVSTVRPNLNGVALVGPEHDGATASTGFCVLRTNEAKLNNRYLFQWVRTRSFVDEMVRRATGASYPAVSDRIIRESRIPLPPLDEQRRIADILDGAEALRAKRRAALAQLDELVRAIFLDMFGDPAREPSQWSRKRIGQLTKVCTGSTPSRAIGQYYQGEIPWVKTTEVRGDVISSTEEQISEEAVRSSRCRVFPPNSVVVALYGQGKTRGKSALLGIHAATNQACGVLLPSAVYSSVFLQAQLALQYANLRALGRGGNQENLNLRILSDFPVLVPPLPLQQEFARRVQAIDRLKSLHRQSLAELDALFLSLQHRAFRGEL